MLTDLAFKVKTYKQHFLSINLPQNNPAFKKYGCLYFFLCYKLQEHISQSWNCAFYLQHVTAIYDTSGNIRIITVNHIEMQYFCATGLKKILDHQAFSQAEMTMNLSIKGTTIQELITENEGQSTNEVKLG